MKMTPAGKRFVNSAGLGRRAHWFDGIGEPASGTKGKPASANSGPCPATAPPEFGGGQTTMIPACSRCSFPRSTLRRNGAAWNSARAGTQSRRLAAKLGRDKVLYDRRYTAEFNREDLDSSATFSTRPRCSPGKERATRYRFPGTRQSYYFARGLA
jgi:hypothetical protein